MTPSEPSLVPVWGAHMYAWATNGDAPSIDRIMIGCLENRAWPKIGDEA